MKIPVKEAKDQIKLWDYVRTNGDLDKCVSFEIEGIVGKINGESFCIWSNDKAWVEILNKDPTINKNTSKIMKINRTLKRILNKNLRDLYKADYINGDLELTEKGKNVLFSILLEEYEEELAKEAREELKEIKKDN